MRLRRSALLQRSRSCPTGESFSAARCAARSGPVLRPDRRACDKGGPGKAQAAFLRARASTRSRSHAEKSGRMSVVATAADGIRVVSLVREIDHGSADHTSPGPGRLRYPRPRTVVDRRQIILMGSNGINIFIGAHRAVSETDGRPRLAAPGEAVMRTLSLVGGGRHRHRLPRNAPPGGSATSVVGLRGGITLSSGVVCVYRWGRWSQAPSLSTASWRDADRRVTSSSAGEGVPSRSTSSARDSSTAAPRHCSLLRAACSMT